MSSESVYKDIPDQLYFGISEVAKLCHVEASVLRYWEKQFDALTPKKRSNGRRYYTREHVLLVRYIKTLLYDEGFTIEGAKAKLIKGSDEKGIDHKRQDAFLKDIVHRLTGVHDQLMALVD